MVVSFLSVLIIGVYDNVVVLHGMCEHNWTWTDDARTEGLDAGYFNFFWFCYSYLLAGGIWLKVDGGFPFTLTCNM